VPLCAVKFLEYTAEFPAEIRRQYRVARASLKAAIFVYVRYVSEQQRANSLESISSEAGSTWDLRDGSQLPSPDWAGAFNFRR